MLAALVKAKKVKDLSPAILTANDAGQKVLTPINHFNCWFYNYFLSLNHLSIQAYLLKNSNSCKLFALPISNVLKDQKSTHFILFFDVKADPNHSNYQNWINKWSW